MLIRNRVKDWLYGLRAAQPDRETHNALNDSAPTEGERFRIVYHLITSPPQEGGAGIRPKSGDWKNVESIFPLHDNAFNKQWISKWSTETFLKPEDLDEIRDRFGEKVSKHIELLISLLLMLLDCLLLRLYSVLLHIPHIPSCLRTFGVGSSRAFQSHICDSQHSLVRYLHRILEAARNRHGHQMGRQGCIGNPAKASRL